MDIIPPDPPRDDGLVIRELEAAAARLTDETDLLNAAARKLRELIEAEAAR
ncbi:hypothetical protein [Streptacidiphilus sp. PAMC 29251]